MTREYTDQTMVATRTAPQGAMRKRIVNRLDMKTAGGKSGGHLVAHARKASMPDTAFDASEVNNFYADLAIKSTINDDSPPGFFHRR